MEFVKRLRLLDMVVLLKDRIDELYEAERIPKATYTRKSSMRLLLKAVNKADRDIHSIRKPVETIALFIPKDIHLFPLFRHEVFTGEHIDSIVESTLLEKHPAAIDIFLNKKPWIELSGIESEYVQVYQEHPTHHLTPSCRIRRVNVENFAAESLRKTVFSYDTENRLLRFSTPFKEDVFLVFEGRTLPGIIKFEQYDAASVSDAEDTELATVELHTPPKFERLVIDVALTNLFPMQTDGNVEEMIYDRTSNREDANGPSFMVPRGMYDYFGQW